MNKGKRWVFKNGKWEEGKAAPEHLREDLRELPADWITKNEADGDRIHELDAPHVVEELKDNLAAKEMAQEKKLDGLATAEKLGAPLANPTEVDLKPERLTHEKVDLLRMVVIKNLVDDMVKNAADGYKVEFKPCYIWFPEDNIHKRELRMGNPPRDKERPNHLRGYDLFLDPLNWPRRIVDMLKERGVQPASAGELLCQIQKKSSEITKKQELEASLSIQMDS